jgi:hypothetical protein
MAMSFVVLAAALAAQPAQPVLHYVRTNSDGSEAERVIVFAPRRGEVHVFKAVTPCTNAAYVIARTDPASGKPTSLVGGRLTRAGTQQPFAWLGKPAGRVEARVGSPDAPPMFSVPTGKDWFLYDFDFADWIAHPPSAIAARQPFSAEMVLLLVGDAPTMTNHGAMELTYAGEGNSGEAAFVHYRAGGPALAGQSGNLWFDAKDNALLAARLPLANHDGYRDFALSLVKREAGEAAWRATLAAHWDGCPAPD